MAFLDKGHKITVNSIKIQNLDNSDSPIAVTNPAGTSLFTVDTSGNTTVAGTLTGTGNQTITGDTTQTGTLTLSKTVATAALGTVRTIHSQAFATFAGTLTSGNLVGCRGVTTIAAGTTAGSGTFIYGAQGKIILLGTEAGGDVAAVVGQLDLSAGTNTSGIVSAGWFDLGSTASGTMGETYLLRVTNTTAATIESHVHMYGKASAVFSIENNGSACTDAGAHGATASGRMVVLHNGATKYIHLFDD